MEPELMNVIVAFVQPFQLDSVVAALRRIPNFPGMSVSEIGGFGSHMAHAPRAGERSEVHPFEPMMRVEIFCRAAEFVTIVEAIRKAAYTGHERDGKIFGGPLGMACRIRTGDLGEAALLPPKVEGLNQ